MKLIRMIAVAALLASSHLVYGQDETDVMSANIPFAFTANGMAMPAGHYVISRVQDFRIWELRTHGRAIFLTATPRAIKQAPQTSRLVFNHEGTSYALLQFQEQAQTEVAQVKEPGPAKESRHAGQQIATVTALPR